MVRRQRRQRGGLFGFFEGPAQPPAPVDPNAPAQEGFFSSFTNLFTKKPDNNVKMDAQPITFDQNQNAMGQNPDQMNQNMNPNLNRMNQNGQNMNQNLNRMNQNGQTAGSRRRSRRRRSKRNSRRRKSRR